MLLAGGVALTAMFWRSRTPPASASVAMSIPSWKPTAVNPVVVPDQAPSVAPAEPGIVGTWEDDFYGKRRFTFREDGTATMVLDLDPVGRLLYGPRLTFFVDWKQTGDRLTLRMTGGEPADVTATVSKLFGETSEQVIESLTADEMQLRSCDSGKLYIHRRVPDGVR